MRVLRWEIVLAMLLCGTLSSSSAEEPHRVRVSPSSSSAVCRIESVSDCISRFTDSTCSPPDSSPSFRYIGVTEVRSVAHSFFLLNLFIYLFCVL